MFKRFLLIFIFIFSSFLSFSSTLMAAGSVQLSELLREQGQQQIEDSFEYSKEPTKLEVVAKDYEKYLLTQHQVLKALKEILGLDEKYILNGNGTNVLVPVNNEDVLLTDTTKYRFCYETLNRLSSYLPPILHFKNGDQYYVNCDITLLFLKNQYKEIKIKNVATFGIKALVFAWRDLTNKGDSEIFYYNNNFNSTLYKKPTFFFNNKHYPIKAPLDYTANETSSAQGYCDLKKNQDFVSKYGKDSVITVKNQEVVELNEYGNPISIEFHKNVNVWNAIICTPDS